MAATTPATKIKLNAGRAATAWLNAFLAAGNDEQRPLLCRTLSVEFFPLGVQFIASDGSLLFRTWCSGSDGQGEEPMPLAEEAPDKSVIVMDTDKFASAFMKTMLSAVAQNEFAQLEMEIEENEDEQSLGEVFASERLTLRAFGQELHCRLHEDAFPNWRQAEFGVPTSERIDGMTLAPRMFATVGKLKGVSLVDCDFSTEESAIRIHARGSAEVRGLMMPMRRDTERKRKNEEDTQEEADLS